MKNQLISNSKLQVLVMFSSVRVKRVVEDNKAAGRVARRPPAGLLASRYFPSTGLDNVGLGVCNQNKEEACAASE